MYPSEDGRYVGYNPGRKREEEGATAEESENLESDMEEEGKEQLWEEWEIPDVRAETLNFPDPTVL